MRRTRRGGTLVELLVALVLLDLALLSLAAVGAATARRLGDAGRRARASLAASNRVERMAAMPCLSMAGGTATLEPGVVESWSASRDASGMELTSAVEIRGRSTERIVVRLRVPCA